MAKNALKELQKIPAHDRERIVTVIHKMAENPFTGDIVRLKGWHTWRRRVGNYRIFFGVEFDAGMINVFSIQRRTSNTY